jgi:uncharacterized protein (TIGR00369 family)
LMKTIGAHLTRILPGAVDIELPLSPAVSQQAGIAHGAALVAIADSAMGYAAFSLMPPGADTATIELKINYLAPAVGESDGCAWPRREGRSEDHRNAGRCIC